MRQLVEPPNPKKPTALRGAAGVWNRQSGNRIRGCDGTRIRAADSLARVGSQSVTKAAALFPFLPASAPRPNPPLLCCRCSKHTCRRWLSRRRPQTSIEMSSSSRDSGRLSDIRSLPAKPDGVGGRSCLFRRRKINGSITRNRTPITQNASTNESIEA